MKQQDLSSLPCEHLSGVGKRMAEKLSRLGITRLQDILFHLPLRYQDRTRVSPIGRIAIGEHVVVEGAITSVTTPKGGRTRLLCRLEDATGHLNLRFFYINSIQVKSLKQGMQLRCFGEVRWSQQGRDMIHPEYIVLEPGVIFPIEKYLTPIYPTTEGLGQTTWRKLTDQTLAMLDHQAVLDDILPHDVTAQLGFPSLKAALQYVHRPPIEAPTDLLRDGGHVAQKRLVFEELLAHRLSLLNIRQLFQKQLANPLSKKEILTEKFLQSLPFSLTSAQQKVTKEICEDLEKPCPMLRLVQGDVGSGKTVVAALAMLQAIENGFQAAMLAPTELLAEQHYRNFQTWFQPLGIRVALLSGKLKLSERREVLENIANGNCSVIIGTHAIFQKDVEFANLTLIIVDEQHRFGVAQRAELREKGVNQNKCPHQLMMTATPIPRTLAMTAYADLECSVIDELPPGRTPVKTSVIPNSRRDDILLRIKEACQSGRQAYWVCTLIEESEVLQCQAAEETLQTLQSMLPELSIALLHGRMKSQEKEDTMAAFKKGDIQLLVATTVIEVGVDVPNASLMIIENAERLGLAQLHQLRGRVGRGAVESYCLLLYQAPLSQHAKDRLAVMKETTDGFRIAQRDLEIRGPGEVLGTKQTGDITLRLADLVRDSHLLPMIQETAALLQKNHPETIDPLIKRWLGNNERFGRV